MRKALYRLIDRARIKSPWILHLDTGGCNGCDIEIFACLTPRYDVERFGMVEKGNPRHADVLMVTGAVTKKMKPRLRRIYDQMPEPKVVVGIGSCAISTGVFQGAYNIAGPLERIIPVDVYVAGCPPKPENIINGVIQGLEIWRRKLEGARK